MKAKSAAACAMMILFGILAFPETGFEAGPYMNPGAEPLAGGLYLGFDAKTESLIDERWAYRAFLDGEAAYGDAFGATVSGGIAFSLKTNSLTWTAEIKQDASFLDGAMTLPFSAFSLRVTTIVDDSLIGTEPYVFRESTSIPSYVETGTKLWFETALGSVVVQPGIGAGIRFRDGGSTAFVLKPGGRMSFFPEIPLYADLYAAWITDTESDSVEVSFKAGWVPVSWLDISAGFGATFDGGSLAYTATVEARADISRNDDIAFLVPVKATMDSEGTLSLSTALRVEIP